MALVTYVTGDCPACGEKDSYGNVQVVRNVLGRGCLKCRHYDRVPLPSLRKRIIYLDQFFFSHAFRGENPVFVSAKHRVQQLAHKQLVVVPYSNLHEDETHLWEPEQRDRLWKFIKQTSSGHKFHEEFNVHMAQLHRAFDAFIKDAPAEHRVEAGDALPRDIHEWNNYVWIDVSRTPDIQRLRVAKEQSVKQLLELFDTWTETASTFEADVRAELRSSADTHVQHYIQYVQRWANGDQAVFLDAPINSLIVEQLMQHGARLGASLRMQRIKAFFSSAHFANVPVERLSSEFFALLRLKLRTGQFANRDKAARRFKGFFYDVRFISTYAPYCDAMVVDAVMHTWATDPLIDLQKRYGTKLFSRNNWGEFVDYLENIDNELAPQIEEDLQLVYPRNAKKPNWAR